MDTNKLKEKINEILEVILDHPLVLSFYERYQESPKIIQKLMKTGCFFLILISLSSIPYQYIKSSFELEKELNEDSQLIQKLGKIKKSSSKKVTVKTKSTSEIISSIKSELRYQRLLPQQIKSVETSPFNTSIYNVLNLKESRIRVNIEKINFKQIIKIAEIIENLGSFIKLTNIVIKKSSEVEKNYFDVLYTVSVLNTGA